MANSHLWKILNCLKRFTGWRKEVKKMFKWYQAMLFSKIMSVLNGPCKSQSKMSRRQVKVLVNLLLEKCFRSVFFWNKIFSVLYWLRFFHVVILVSFFNWSLLVSCSNYCSDFYRTFYHCQQNCQQENITSQKSNIK